MAPEQPTPVSFLGCAEQVVAAAEAMGLKVNPTSRFGTYLRLFRDVEGGHRVIPQDHPEFKTAVRGFGDVTLLQFALDAISPAAKDTPEYRATLRCALKDAIEFVPNSMNSPGRDAELQLYCLAVLCRAGMEPRLVPPSTVRMPDVSGRFDGVPFNVECKRIKSPDRVGEAIESAVGQLATMRQAGIILLDITPLANPLGEAVIGVEEVRLETKHAEARRAIDELIRPAILQRTLGKRWAWGCVVINHQHAALSTGDWQVLTDAAYHTLGGGNDGRRQWFFRWRDAWGSGLPSPPYLRPENDPQRVAQAMGMFRRAWGARPKIQPSGSTRKT